MVFNSLSIVLPAFNEEARLNPALDELFAYLQSSPKGLPATVDVLVVDDGSSDGTAALVRARAEYEDGGAATQPGRPLLRLLSLPHAGKGSAVRAGMLAAQGDLIVFADADMATPPDQLPCLVEALADADLALGQPDPAATVRTCGPRSLLPAAGWTFIPPGRADLGDGSYR